MSRFFRIVLTGLFLFVITASASASVNYSEIINKECAWLKSLQLPSGAVVMTKNSTFAWKGGKYYKIEPYFANLALIGLLDNPTNTNVTVVKNWLSWYFNHLNMPDYNKVNGSVYVYYADTNGGAEHASNEYDSTDSYAATFLTLLKKYYVVSGDRQYLLDNKTNIELIASAMLSTQQSDGLTFAKPDYQIKYLMDNTEVYEGLDSVAYLEKTALNDNTKAAFYNQKKSKNLSGIGKLWYKTGNCYDVYQGCHSTLTNFYPDATCQMFPIWTNVISAGDARAKALYDKLNANFPGWPTLSTPDAFPWAILCYSAAKLNDKTRVDTFLSSVKTKFIDTNHPWTWYNMEAGFTIRAAAAMSGINRSGKSSPGKIHL